MSNYKGQYKKNGKVKDEPQRGGEYVEEHGEAHETCNFLPDKNGTVYGHVETWKGNENGRDTNININNLGANKEDYYVDNIDIIWTATHKLGGKRIVGWYMDARVYRSRQQHGEYPTNQHKRDSISSFRIVSKKENIYLIPEGNRNIKLDKNKVKKGWSGQNSVFYPSNHKDNEELMDLLNYINKLMKKQIIPLDPFEETWDTEGETKLKYHRKKERSAKLVKAFKESLTDYSCSICDFSFEDTYGDLGEKYIEAHHIIPISSLKKKTRISIKDFAPVCSNCHRMLHRKNPPISVEKLRTLIKKF